MHKASGRAKRLKQRHFIYDLVEDTDVKKKKPIDVILTCYVEGIGDRGDRVTMPPLRAYNRLLLPGLGVYATPENIVKYDSENEDRAKTKYSSPYVPRTVDILKNYLLNITMSYENPWKLEKYHVRSALRKAGIFLTDDCLTLPERDIIGPNVEYENKEFYITITINKREQVKVRCRIHHWSNSVTAKIPVVKDFYKKKSEAIFPEDQAVLDEMPIPYHIKTAIELEAKQAL